jgi:hypothetical protein
VERSNSATELGNVAHYFQFVHPERARELLERAKSQEPQFAPQWTQRIEQLGVRDVLNVRGHAVTERALGRTLPRDTRKLSDDDLDALERRLLEAPGDLVARATLISAYSSRHLSALQANALEAPKLCASVASHLGWLIDNEPGAREISRVGGDFLQRVDPEGYADLTGRWDRALDRHADNAQVHANAASFYAINDPARALELLERAAELEPYEPEWSRQLAQQIELTSRGASPDERSRGRLRICAELEHAVAKEAKKASAGEAPPRNRVAVTSRCASLLTQRSPRRS